MSDFSDDVWPEIVMAFLWFGFGFCCGAAWVIGRGG